MATITSKNLIDQIIEHGGRQYPDEPPVTRIVEYKNVEGEPCWGVTWEGEDVNRYILESPFVRQPKIIFDLMTHESAKVDNRTRCVVDNRLGLRYHLIDAGPNTEVVLEGKPSRAILIPYPYEKVRMDWGRWRSGLSIQHAFGYLPADQREFFMTAILPEEWGVAFPPDTRDVD